MSSRNVNHMTLVAIAATATVRPMGSIFGRTVERWGRYSGLFGGERPRASQPTAAENTPRPSRSSEVPSLSMSYSFSHDEERVDNSGKDPSVVSCNGGGALPFDYPQGNGARRGFGF